MGISIQRLTSIDDALEALASTLEECSIFDAVNYENGTLTAIKSSKELFTMTAGTNLDYAWKNIYGTTLQSGYMPYPSNATENVVCRCGNNVMFITYYLSQNPAPGYHFIFGNTKNGNVFMGFDYNHINDNTIQCFAMCDSTTTLYPNAFAPSTATNAVWSRFTPVCVQSVDNTVEVAEGISGFMERYIGIPLTTGTSPVPTKFTLDNKTYLTNGTFVLEDPGV